MANLAGTLASLGRLREAEELGQAMLEKRKRVLGEEHPDVLRSMANLTEMCMQWKAQKEPEHAILSKLPSRRALNAPVILS